MRLDQFTVKAQEALTSAQAEAERSDHPEVTPEHLLKALLVQEGGVVPAALGKMGLATGGDRGRRRQGARRRCRAPRAPPPRSRRSSTPC